MEKFNVKCCQKCKSLNLLKDNFNNIVCGNCNSINKTESSEDINGWFKEYGKIWRTNILV